MKEEDEIVKKAGMENAFKVPEGYFENLTSDVMNKLPEKEPTDFIVKEPTKWQKLKPFVYMAAMFIGAALIIKIASSNHETASTEMAATETTDAIDYESDEYINAVLDGSMMDDYSLYVYLTDAGVNEIN